MNTDIDTATLKDTLMPVTTDYPEIADDYRNIMENAISESSATGARKIMLMALSYKPTGNIDNARILFNYYQELSTLFASLGSETKQLNPKDVFEVLYKFYHQLSDVPFIMPDHVSGNRIKNYISPAYFKFKKHEIEIGEQLTRVLFVKEYATYVDDEIVRDFIDNSHKITVSKHIRRVAKSKAMEILRKKIFNVELQIQKRMEQNHKTGGDFIPFTLSNKMYNFKNQIQI